MLLALQYIQAQFQTGSVFRQHKVQLKQGSSAYQLKTGSARERKTFPDWSKVEQLRKEWEGLYASPCILIRQVKCD